MNKSYYAILPAAIRYNKAIPAAAKLFYAEITALTNQRGYCYAKNIYFMELYEVSERTVRDWLGHLKRENMVSVQQIKDQGVTIERRIYIINVINVKTGPPEPAAKNCPTPDGKKLPHPPAKNCRHNTILDNTIDISNTLKSITDKKKEINIENNLHKNLRGEFEALYNANKPAPYYWTAKDAGQLAQLIKKIQFQIRITAPNETINTPDQIIIDTFTHIVQAIIKDDASWNYNNLSIALLNSKFNEILGYYGKQAFTRSEGASLIDELYK